MTFKHTIIAFAVWGEAHRHRFIDYALPSVLQALPEDSRQLRPRLVIFTTSTDAAWLKDELTKDSFTSMFRSRMNHYAPEFIHFLPGDHDGSSMVACQKEALRIAWAEKSALSWMYPDCWVMPGSFNAVAGHVHQHARACMYQAFTVLEGPARVMLMTDYSTWDEHAPRRVGWDLLKHIHPTSAARAWDDTGRIVGTTSHPGMLYRFPTEELPLMVMNAVHLGPIWVRPRRLAVDFQTSMDGDFIETAGLSIEEIDVLTRGFFMVELAPPEKKDPGDSGAILTPDGIRRWFQDHTTPINRLLFGRPIIMARDVLAKIPPGAEAELLGRLTYNAREMAKL